MNTAEFVLDQAEKNPTAVLEKLSHLHEKGETVADILEFLQALETRMIRVNIPPNLRCKKIFDVCGTGGSGKSRINLSTALAVRLSSRFCIAKHGNKAASGKTGSFDLIDLMELEIADTPVKVVEGLESKNLAFIFAPAFHPALKPLAPIRKALGHPTIFNYLGPILNPVSPLKAQMTGVSNPQIGEKLAEACQKLGKNILLVHDTVFGLDDVSIGGTTQYWKVINGKIRTGTLVPENYDMKRVDSFEAIQGGNTQANKDIFEALIKGTAPQAHIDFLRINKRVAQEFFESF
jgi:anthranilate phosphoribosyltransferase